MEGCRGGDKLAAGMGFALPSAREDKYDAEESTGAAGLMKMLRTTVSSGRPVTGLASDS